MNISNLKAFIETVQASSISKAADNLHLTQPAVSMQLQNLETSLGHQLLNRSNRGVQLTEYGKVFFSYAQSFLTLWDNLQQDLKAVAASEYPSLQVGTCPAIGQYALPCALFLFKQIYPQIRVSVQSLSSQEVISELRNRTLHTGFLEGIPHAPDLESHLVLRSELILVASSSHPKTAVDLADLPGLPLVLTPPDCDIRRSLERSLARYQMDSASLKPFLELDGLESVKSAVISGHGLSFLPYIAIKKELFSGDLQRVFINGATFEITFSMVWRKNESLSEDNQQLINFIRNDSGKSFC
ncbi:DNA-binding transcriptional LysR family regulator [Hydrogenispora ethanolica]|jgi:DNA-binding transcriptional LysR family regulator|uniref:DNA-binding transcriptional LysR family regulator n=1 Tax=Hydrogenispora ethanolica TaxID=1082276 RepID=A0A4V2QEU6_HYDET|nr:LysR family transcriptional regulator [Hydrogenispora ethanolica]TCL69407.1 DNA-binding transcriptional LysR family regulator [Hydrogenispora ethanolica]